MIFVIAVDMVSLGSMWGPSSLKVSPWPWKLCRMANSFLCVSKTTPLLAPQWWMEDLQLRRSLYKSSLEVVVGYILKVERSSAKFGSWRWRFVTVVSMS